MEERKQGDLEVFKWFKVHVIESKLEPSIEHQELVSDPNTDLLCCLFTFYSA